MLASVVLGSQSWACLALLHLDATVRRTCHGDPVGFRRMADMLSRPSFYLPKNSVLDSKLLILPFGAIWGVCMYVCESVCERETADIN